MAHIGQATNNPHLFWYNDKVGMLILEYVWMHLHNGFMDDNQLLIVKDEESKATELFAELGYDVQF